MPPSVVKEGTAHSMVSRNITHKRLCDEKAQYVQQRRETHPFSAIKSCLRSHRWRMFIYYRIIIVWLLCAPLSSIPSLSTSLFTVIAMKRTRFRANRVQIQSSSEIWYCILSMSYTKSAPRTNGFEAMVSICIKKIMMCYSVGPPPLSVYFVCLQINKLQMDIECFDLVFNNIFVFIYLSVQLNDKLYRSSHVFRKYCFAVMSSPFT